MTTGNFLATLGEEGLREKVVEVAKEVKSRAWELAGLLYEVKKNNLFVAWGHNDWNEYIDREVGLGKRAINQYIANWKTYRLRLGVETEKLNELEWTKARVIRPVVNQENVEEWIEKARSSSREELISAVKQSQDLVEGDEEEIDRTGIVKHVTLTFDLEQFETWETAVEKAKWTLGTDSDNWAADAMAQSYMQEFDDPVFTKDQFLRRASRMYKCDLLSIDWDEKETLTVNALNEFIESINDQRLEGTIVPVYIPKESSADVIQDILISAVDKFTDNVDGGVSAEELSLATIDIDDPEFVDIEEGAFIDDEY